MDQSNFVIDFPDKQVLNFDYEIVQLNRLHWRDFLKQQNPVAALMAKMKIEPRDRPQVKAKCLRLMVTLQLDPAKMQLISGFVDTYLNLNSTEEEIFQAELSTMELEQREQIMQITTSWERKGQTSTILRLLNRKFGTLPEATTSQIESLESTQLDALTENLLDFQTINDLNQWLSNL